MIGFIIDTNKPKTTRFSLTKVIAICLSLSLQIFVVKFELVVNVTTNQFHY